MRPPSLRITNRPKPRMRQRRGRSGKRSGRKEADSRASSNVYTGGSSDLEETSTDSEEDTSDPDSEWECEDTSSPGSEGAEEGECPTCSRTAEVMRNWTGNEAPGIRVGTFGACQQEKQRCDTCRRFVDYFTKEFRKREGVDASLRDVTPVFLSRSTSNWAFRVGESKGISVVLSLLWVSRSAPAEMRGVIPDKSWINLKRVKRWATRCDREHAAVCHSFSDPWLKVDLPSRMILIDTKDKRLVYAPRSASYLALSYVWGKGVDPLNTTLGNFSSFRLHNAFDLPGYRKRLPKTIRDSMVLTRLLGQRYLWVDRFCIVQDDMEHKAEQLKAMASIYANAYLTIVAYDGDDDNYGLRGVGKGSEPRECTLQEFRFASDCHLVSSWASPSRKFVYPTRGWTFQEREVSRRQLVFQHGVVSWRCKLHTWDENRAAPGSATAGQQGAHHQADLFARWPNLPHYARLVRTYNDCKLTYPGDALDAFSALTSIMARSMRGGVLFGLPEMFFDGCLLWKPDGAVQRRQQEAVLADGTVASEIIDKFPSWSWVGWAGTIDVRMWQDAHRFVTNEAEALYPIHEPYLTITRIVDWFKVNEKSGDKEPIQNSYYESSRPPQLPAAETNVQKRDVAAVGKGRPASRRKNQQQRSEPPLKQRKPSVAAKANDHVLPPGWTFRHHVLLAREPFAPDAETWSPVLEFRAQTCFFAIGTQLGKPRGSSGCVTASLVKDLGSEPDNIVGAIILNTSNPQEIPTGTRCELIAVSRGDADWVANSWTIRREFPEAELLHRHCPDNCTGEKGCKGPRLYSFYNTLWVEWKEARGEKIALRKGLGRVYQPFWDAQRPDTIDVKLG